MKKFKLFFGWYIVGAGFLMGAYISGFIYFGFTAIIEPVVDEFGWSYAQVSFAASLRGLEMSILAPIVGLLMDRWGPRRLIPVGAVFIGIGLFLLSRVNSLALFYGAFILIAAGISVCSGVVPISVISNWFRRKLTTATGILVSGIAVGGLLIPVATRLIDTFDWKFTMAIIGLGALVILLPLSFLFRHNPEQYGYFPDGDSRSKRVSGETKSPEQNNGVNIGVRQIIISRTFWHIAIGFMCHVLVINALITHVMPYMSSIGINRTFSSLAASAIPLISILGRLTFGWFGDRYSKKLVTVTAFILVGVGMLSIAYVTVDRVWLLILALIFVGVGYGGPVPMQPALAIQYFGRTRLATLLGLIMGIASLGGIVGPPLAGFIFDKFGSYHIAWFIFSILIILGLVSLATTPVFIAKHISSGLDIDNVNSVR
ncbi:MAG: MFS transporter [Dehalococcoidales bacterium]|nr:MFS transporter [Dehalococcoidales bacterium]